MAMAWLSFIAAGCGGTASDPSSSASPRAIVISSTNTPGPKPAASGPAAPVSTVLTPFASSTPAQPSAAAAQTPAGSAASASVTAANQVQIQDFSFAPPTLSVKVGARVTWTNGGPSNHTVTANDGSFDSGPLQRNANFSFTFSKAGSVTYHCTVHPTMQATVTVS
jgi:plastocyanin